MKRFFVALIVMLLFCLGVVWANFIVDWSFEDSEANKPPLCWKVEGLNQGDEFIVVEEKFRGIHALKTTLKTLEGEIKGLYKYNPSVVPGQQLILKVAIALEDKKLISYGVRLEVQSIGGALIACVKAEPELTSWQGWQEYSTSFTVPPEVYSLQLVIYRSGLPGTAWFDDIRLDRLSTYEPVLLAPVQVHQGEKFYLKGADFPPFSKITKVKLSEIYLTPPDEQTNGQGAFYLTLTMPVAELRTHSLEVEAGGWVGNTSIQVLPPETPRITGIKFPTLVTSRESFLVTMAGDPGGRGNVLIKDPLAEKDKDIIVDLLLEDKKGIGIYEGEYRPPLGWKRENLVVVGKLNKGNPTNVLEAKERVSINTIVPKLRISILSTKGLPIQPMVANRESFILRVELEPPEECEKECRVEIDISPLDTTQKIVTIPSTNVKGLFEKTLSISGKNKAENGEKLVKVTATTKVGNIGEAQVMITLDNPTAKQSELIIYLAAETPIINALQEEVIVRMIGQSGGQAKVSIPALGLEISLEEKEKGTGIYTGIFKPPKGVALTDVPVIGRLTIGKKGGTMEVKIAIFNTVLPSIVASVENFLKIFKNGDEVWLMVKTEAGSLITADLSQLDTTNPSVKFVEDPMGGLFRASFIISEKNEALDGEKTISIKVVNPIGNENEGLLTVTLKNKPDEPKPECPKPEFPEYPEPESPEKIYKLHLQAGLNMISVPLNPGSEWRISDLVNHLGKASVAMVIWYDVGSKKFVTYLPTSPENSPANTLIRGDQGYIVNMKREVDVTFTGAAWQSEPIALSPEVFMLLLGNSESKLLQNYPNPFNLDTWIPYTLAGDDKVIIQIYSLSGRLVRTLNLGHQPEGCYVTKDKAAYWDGRDSFGEKVASGVYFYALQAGKFRATRRMVILK